MPTPGWFDGFETREFAVNGTRIHARLGGRADAPPLLLLHGFPQTHAMWHRVAQALAPHHRLVLPDLRGYGDSAHPAGEADHANYSKRTMARDMHELMVGYGHDHYFVCGHDRGGRVAHRLALDYPQAVRALMLLDISPTLTMYERTDMQFAQAYYHWFFLTQPAPLPERLIGADPVFYLHRKIGAWGSAGTPFFDPRALAEYERCFADPQAIHAMCEDYRAAIGIDLEHDRSDARERIRCPLRALWGERGVVHRLFTPVADWQAKAESPDLVSGRALPGGHYIAEELPTQLIEEIAGFFPVS
jgi:haloacetate dehalogenase